MSKPKESKPAPSSHDVGYEMGFRAAMQEAINTAHSVWVSFEFQTVKEIGAPIHHATLARLSDALKRGPIR